MKRLPFLLLACAGHGLVAAQLNNGSFEQDGGPSLQGWEWTCATPGQPNTAAPGNGAWCATKEAGQAKGCFPSYLFQRLPGLENGDLVTLTGWVKCGMMPPCVGASIGLGSLQNGLFAPEEAVTSTDVAWTYLTITDTVEIGANDTAVVLLSGGFIGGPIGPEPAYFDGLALAPSLSVHDRSAPDISHLLDREARQLHISTGSQRITDLHLFDLTGRRLPLSFAPLSGTVQVDLHGMPVGVYFVRMRTDQGDRTIRFTLW